MYSSRFALARRILFVVVLSSAALIVPSKSSAGFKDDDDGGGEGVACPRSSPPCSPLDSDDRGGESTRGKRSTVVVDLDDLLKRARASFPHWQSRFRARHRLRPESDSAYPAVKVRAASAFWKGQDFPPETGFWRPSSSGLERSGANDPGSVEEAMGTEFQDRKRLDQLMEDDVDIQNGSPTGLPSKQRRRQEGLTRPEFNPTGW